MKLKKILIGGGLGLVVLVVVAVFAVVLLINSIARKGIEAGATYALGVNTTLGSASIGLFSGQFGLAKLKVSNPGGFPAPHFLALGDVGVAVSLASLTRDTIEVPKFTLDSLDVHLERKDGKSNYEAILDNLARLSGEPKPGEPEPPEKEGKKFVIRELSITNVTVHVDMLGVPGAAVLGDATGAAAKATIPIKEIKLTDVGKTGEGVAGTGVTIGELSSIIVQAVLAAAVETGGNLIPDDVGKAIVGRVSELGGLSDLGINVGGKGLDTVAGIAKGMGKELAPAVEDVGKTIEGLGGGLGDLLGGGKKKK